MLQCIFTTDPIVVVRLGNATHRLLEDEKQREEPGDGVREDATSASKVAAIGP